MQLSKDQESALLAINKWSRGLGAPVFALGGFAGTGKTTIVQEWINGLDSPVICCAPTGKAAAVLRKRLNHTEVSTIHRALYKPLPPPSLTKLRDLEAQLELFPEDEVVKEQISMERFRLERKQLKFSAKEKRHQLIQQGDLVVVDEASMVTKQMLEDFVHTGARILFVGDPGQLPPVNDSGFFSTYKPDAMLTEIHRQALDSAVLRLSLRIRNGEPIAPFEEEGCAKVSKSSVEHQTWIDSDQVITGSNASRRRINRFFRRVKGIGEAWTPAADEKLICLKNAEEYKFINGAQARAISKFHYSDNIKAVVGEFIYEGQVMEQRCFYPFPFRATYEENLKEIAWWERINLVDMLEFDYAYAITVHKAQGSEWDRVIIADDQMMSDNKDFRKNWLYTAVTRAKKELLWLY